MYILAIADASIGSKTAVNTEFGKNLVGSLYDPSLIIVNPVFLDSLDDRNFSNGMAEIIKMGMIRDEKLFSWLKKYSMEDLRKPSNSECLLEILKISMKNKLEVVENDRLELDQRKILNFGHTLGHGIEFASQE